MQNKTIAIIDKAPSRNNYSWYFDFPFDLYHMSSVPISKLLKKDVDLVVDLSKYDLVILVGAEAAKHYAKITSVTNFAGLLVDDKFVCITNPAMLGFKPEGKKDFDKAVEKIKQYASDSFTKEIKDENFVGILDREEAYNYLVEVLESNAPFVALDTETTALYPRDGYIIGVSISYKKGYGKYIIADIFDEELVQLLQKIIDKYIIVFHNLKFDVAMLEYHFNLSFDKERVHDTILMHYVLDENGSHSLKDLAIKYTDYGDYDAPLEAYKKEYCAKHGMLEEDFTYDLIPFDIICVYASKDTGVSLELKLKFLPIIEANPRLLWVYKNLMLAGSFFLKEIQEVGIPINKERLIASGNYLNTWIDKAKEEIYTFEEVKQFEKDFDKVFNPNSVQQLRSVLFDYVGLTPTGKLTKTNAISTDAEVLEELSEEHELPKAILKVRQLGKIKSSYVDKILPELDKDGRIRTNFNQIFTTSGRLSSSGKFNAQQIPRDEPMIKGCIYAPEGFKIVSQDLETAEMYYAAVLSKDKNLQSVFKSGEDFHSSIAKMVFDLPCEPSLVKKLFPEERQSAKAISFGILYGSGPAKVAATVSKSSGKPYPFSRAVQDIDAYFTKFNRLKNWLEERKEFIQANGYTYSFFGRKRRLLNVFSNDKGIAAHEVRSGINAEIQSLASDINLLSAIDAHEELKRIKLPAHIFMLVHDSIVAVVRDDVIEEYCKILQENTQRDRGCSIPGTPIGITQDIGQDYSFGEFEHKYRIENNILVLNESNSTS